MTLSQLKYVITVANARSMNEAAKQLFISQPSLSVAIKELEKEIKIEIFRRNNKGITLTPEGEEFIGYARQVVEQYDLIENKYISNENEKKKFSVSMQHYTFAVNAFIETVKNFGMDEFEFAVYETRTSDIIEDVKKFKSEIGILYINDFNRKIMNKIFKENSLEFHEVMTCSIYAYMAKTNPLAKKEMVTLEELAEYPCLSFDQGINNSFYFAEEVLSTYDHKKIIKVNDRATILNFMIGMDGYTLCSGIICEDLNGSDYCAVKVDTDEKMTVGYITRKDCVMSELGKMYIDEISKYKEQVME
ncbi:LysR family transcriptional regulator [Eubacterium uniforme]|uniref:DNA-binding transcriptional regulator, LysR family n=1 Tax=Eubacterium uniforme TaxID=39495 RepID=A0A1T4VVI8_9FIRM|nr:LysR family transcriptional regulator [Eubacterium uniforme]SKA69003.1 DNA-binding transcriptional regulator, LysR family [Eubacterium uniforme]HAH17502.1 LysR family transcriptional regulator [Eubacterium sp.]HAV90616.1 LysR family transcriptional regulator [Eubacterium sp.]